MLLKRELLCNKLKGEKKASKNVLVKVNSLHTALLTEMEVYARLKIICDVWKNLVEMRTAFLK